MRIRQYDYAPSPGRFAAGCRRYIAAEAPTRVLWHGVMTKVTHAWFLEQGDLAV